MLKIKNILYNKQYQNNILNIKIERKEKKQISVIGNMKTG
jgi:hypothetical protein